MRKSILKMSLFFSIFLVLQGCQDEERNNEVNVEEEVQAETAQDNTPKELENTDLVPSGTYVGTAIVVDDQQKEVYLRLDDKTKIELYFNNQTELVRNGETVPFEQLEEGQRLRVTVQKEGNSLKPQRVEILEE